MVLTEVAFVLWFLNCLIVSALAHFVGWGMAATIVAGGWTMICTIGCVGEHFVDREETKRLHLRELFTAMAYMLCILAALLIFPVIYFGILAHGRYEAWKEDRIAREREDEIDRGEA